VTNGIRASIIDESLSCMLYGGDNGLVRATVHNFVSNVDRI